MIRYFPSQKKKKIVYSLHLDENEKFIDLLIVEKLVQVQLYLEKTVHKKICLDTKKKLLANRQCSYSQGLDIDLGSYILSLTLQITSRNASKSYMKMVDNSSLGNSDEVKFLYSLAKCKKERGDQIIHYQNYLTFRLCLQKGC